jgi:hypothetical protein
MCSSRFKKELKKRRLSPEDYVDNGGQADQQHRRQDSRLHLWHATSKLMHAGDVSASLLVMQLSLREYSGTSLILLLQRELGCGSMS